MYQSSETVFCIFENNNISLINIGIFCFLYNLLLETEISFAVMDILQALDNDFTDFVIWNVGKFTLN